MRIFNPIDCAHYAYSLVWSERQYLIKLAFIPILIKFAFFMLSVLYGESGNIIRMSLIMLPAYFAEGWMLCHFVRLISNGQRWPYRLTGDDTKDLQAAKERGKPLIAGILGFVIINLAMALYFSGLMSFVPPEMLMGQPVDSAYIPKETGYMISIMLLVMFFLFRFVWLYIPIAMHRSPLAYFKRSNLPGFTIRLIAVWLICFIPTMFVMQLIVSPFMVEGASAVMDTIGAFIRIAFDTLKNIIVTAGIGFAILFTLNDPKENNGQGSLGR
ncbi:MAG: hypothetical protein AAF988_03775 [Pseudomonadota bacterium]